MWEAIRNESDKKGIEEIGEASASFEHCFEFWGTWRVKKPGITLKYLENSKNWSKGIKITQIKQAQKVRMWQVFPRTKHRHKVQTKQYL